MRRKLDDTSDENDEGGDSEYDPEEEKTEEYKSDAIHGVRHVNSTVATIPQTDGTADLLQQLKRLIDSAGVQEKQTTIIAKSSGTTYMHPIPSHTSHFLHKKYC